MRAFIVIVAVGIAVVVAAFFIATVPQEPGITNLAAVDKNSCEVIGGEWVQGGGRQPYGRLQGSFCNIRDRDICIRTGGEWTRVEGGYFCILLYPDAGRSCTSSTQCFGGCIIQESGDPGSCALNPSPLGCWGYIETGLVSCLVD